MALPLKKIVSRNVKSIRNRQGLSQAKLAEKSGLSVRYLSKVENDPMEITLHNLEKIADGLGVGVVELVVDSKLNMPKFSKQEKEALLIVSRIFSSIIMD